MLDPRVWSSARQALERAGTRDVITVGPAGTTTIFVMVHGARRRALEIDRHGTLVSALGWRDDGALREAAARIPDRSWVVIDPTGGPREAAEPTPVLPWGPCDRVWHADGPALTGADPLTAFTALDWTRIDEIPTMAEPARLPPGAGTAVLNVIASLAMDQGQHSLVYRGPFASEQLLLALLESFRYTPPVADPLDAFIRGELAWQPMPHERCFEPPGVYVQRRGLVEKVVWRRTTYYRRDWQSVTRHAPRRIGEEADGRTRCSLWALGEPVEPHLEIDRDGAVGAVLEPPPVSSRVQALDRSIVTALARAVASASAPALAPAIVTVGEALRIEWGPVDGDLVAVDGDRLRLSNRLGEAGARRLRGLDDPRARVAVALAVFSESAGLVGDVLRARAQAMLAELPPDEQARALAAASEEANRPAVDLRSATTALLNDLSSWRG
jgi:hypothetical protein